MFVAVPGVGSALLNAGLSDGPDGTSSCRYFKHFLPVTKAAATIVHVGLGFDLIGGSVCRYYGVFARSTSGTDPIYATAPPYWFPLVCWATCGPARARRLFFRLFAAVRFRGFFLLPFWIATAFGFIAGLASGIYSLKVATGFPGIAFRGLRDNLLAWFRIFVSRRSLAVAERNQPAVSRRLREPFTGTCSCDHHRTSSRSPSSRTTPRIEPDEGAPPCARRPDASE